MLCSLSQNFKSETKIKAVCILLSNEKVIEDGRDVLSQWRDSFPFLKGSSKDVLIDLLKEVCTTREIPEHERLITACMFYRNFHFSDAYDCFVKVLDDDTMSYRYRLEAAKYLLASDEEEYLETAQEVVLDLLTQYDVSDDKEFSSQFRYGTIVDFSSRSGVKTFLSMERLGIPYNEDFVYTLQRSFFTDENNGVRERLLSGQVMLQMDSVSQEEKLSISQVLLGVAKDSKLDENTRGDAADMLTRVGPTQDLRNEAKQIIRDMGMSAVSNKRGLAGARTVYADSQNVHVFSDQVDRFIEILVDGQGDVRTYETIHDEVISFMKTIRMDSKERFSTRKALNRVSSDTATFTKFKISLQEIFVCVWEKIESYPKNARDQLKKRMVEELSDMSDTCSSGHSSRFINVLSSYDTAFKISWHDQIMSNIVGRLNARIRNCEDEDVREACSIAQTELADEEDIKVYNDFIKSSLVDLKDELYKEFVEGNYTSAEVFNDAFDLGTMKVFIDTERPSEARGATEADADRPNERSE